MFDFPAKCASLNRLHERTRRRKRNQLTQMLLSERMAASEVQLDDRQFTAISKALADPKRFEILRKIGESERAPTCSCLTEWIGLAPATVSHHLKELHQAELIQIEREGKFSRISLRRDVWQAYLQRLSAL
jgi:ArsR family transcriptional regulator, arsenate/arsenite/antimonite-responsive transcriptional repressor